MRLTLLRSDDASDCTPGTLLCGDFSCVTLEPPWKENERNKSCIPCGVYTLQRHYSPKFGECFAVLNVPDRDDILVHPGNTVEDTSGCILVGLAKRFDGKWTFISQSRRALTDLLIHLSGERDLELEIRWERGE